MHESGSGLIPMNTSNNVNVLPNVSVPPPNMMMPPVGVPPPDMNPGNINVIGNAVNRRSTDVFAKENTIQVRRDSEGLLSFFGSFAYSQSRTFR